MEGRPWFIEGMWTRFAFGLLFACGYAILVYDLLAARPREAAVSESMAAAGS